MREPDVGQRRMGTVEHAQLGGFIGCDVGDQFGANRFPARARPGEAVLDHPLAEGLGHHGGMVSHAEPIFIIRPNGQLAATWAASLGEQSTSVLGRSTTALVVSQVRATS